jgi:hypothetical protein
MLQCGQPVVRDSYLHIGWQVLTPCASSAWVYGVVLPRQLVRCQAAGFAECCLRLQGVSKLNMSFNMSEHVGVWCGTCDVLLRCQVHQCVPAE